MPGGDVDRELLTGDLSDLALVLAAAGFAAVWEGTAMDPAALLADHDGDMKGLVSGLVQRGRCEIDGEGRLVGIHGLTLRPTRHWFVHSGVTRHTWCAFDAIGIPAALALDAIAHTDCRACRRALEVVIVGGEPHRADEVVLWLPAPDVDHLIDGFCATADLYCSSAHLNSSVDVSATPGEVVDLGAAAAKGRAAWADVASI
jgi:hypothetical protein